MACAMPLIRIEGGTKMTTDNIALQARNIGVSFKVDGGVTHAR